MASAIDFEPNVTIEGRLSTSSNCSWTSSVSNHEQYTQATGKVRKSGKWRKMLKEVVEEGKRSIFGSSKPLIFRYDVVSYALNFDEGNHSDEHY
ncbi:hypothetical protein OSB04_007380 [Centaurea solstitialis]|uniref:Uncharacterized protein n=1 Tax=Centaurea solstitialis TaxID=347529 RepID=A0AA38WQU5_9ASTR|nr:hypothetical protein OSB04_007380 [Centaurea solstitialis]